MADGKKAAIGLGIGGAVIAGLMLATRAKAVPTPAPPAPSPGLCTLYGTVTDARTNKPIPGAIVTLDGMETDTNENGYFVFSDIESGDYTMSVTKEGYEPWLP